MKNKRALLRCCLLLSFFAVQGGFTSYVHAAHASPPTPATVVGDSITNPSTGVDETVNGLIQGTDGTTNYVVTTVGNRILAKTTVGDLISVQEDETTTEVYEVISNSTNATTGLIDTVEIRPSTAPDTDPTTTEAVVTDVSDEFGVPDDAVGSPGAPAFNPPLTTSGVINEISTGRDGGNGNDGYGVRICDPFGLLGCTTIGYAGTEGGDGATGPTVNRTIPASHGLIQSIANSTPGITIGSIGGDGGQGGDGYIAIPGQRGGDGGAGGTVTVTNNTDVNVSGTNSYGLYSFSKSGTAGDGGSAIGIGGYTGGKGGTARSGGTVRVTNNGTIETRGAGGHGIYALSTGGTAGNGGGSWGLVGGAGGSGAAGGNGGSVFITNNGTINTYGIGAHGILGQSIGGTGGNGGDAGGLVLTFGGGASQGGRGGNVSITTQANSSITTRNDKSAGIVAQSIGGSGGDSGAAGSIVSLGGSGGSGNHAGTVTVNNLAGSTIVTGGSDAYGILAQSIGGGGGNTSSTGGAVTIGGNSTGSSGGNGNLVRVTTGANITTTGGNAHGIFAQSIGGGGGSAGGSGGIVALGGRGAAGGNGSTVDITNNVAGVINTTGINSHAIFAQSIGGGGGAGANSGGLVAIGGGGSAGGTGGTVLVTNSGALTTQENNSRGIFVQSIGGGGGAGGGSGGLVSIGGSGSNTSGSGSVTVNNTGGISTGGENAAAIFAQSIGGGGGDGGASGGMVSVGGSGGSGGAGGRITVDQRGNITTGGNDSVGIFAQSVGGGGGNGGSSGSVGAFTGVAIGGNGAAGGAGGNVDVTLQGIDANTASVISTTGDRSTGLFAQSVGGGGGNGGGAVQVSGGLFAAASIAVGGQGGAGGAGGNVTMSKGSRLSIIETGGNDSAGAFIQSVGGGGGNGGYAVSAAASVGLFTGSLSVGVGGKGATGGAGGTVSVGTFTPNGSLSSTGFNGSILTTGERSTGFLAQSVGGGGGNGGLAVSVAASGSKFASGSVGIGIGGSGDGGGAGGQVSVGIQGNITTEKINSTGLLAQSVGGGGGNGGGTIAASLSGAVGAAGAVSVGVGGSAGTGSSGGKVTVATRSGKITTKGDNSTGITVQSVGGGGGNGGYSISASLAGAGKAAGSVNVGIGGKAGGGGDGGTVSADLQSDVTTSSVLIPEAVDPITGEIIPEHYGLNAAGIVVQSVGGGGGNGGYTVSAGLTGAGGGAGVVSVGLGGSGGVGGDGGTVTSSSSGTILTQGDSSTGFLTQSVGGGGGNGGFNVSAGISGAGKGSAGIAVGLGGKGGPGGLGGNVNATSSGGITATGDHSSAFIAQSIGGSGGNGGFNVSGTLSGAGTASGSVNVGLGGTAGAGSDAGNVTALSSGIISTAGDESFGVLAQSVGGGGGSGGFNVSAGASAAAKGSGTISVGLGGNGGGGGDAGTVNLTVNETVSTTGNRSGAVVAQSIGGGGGSGGFNVSVAAGGAGKGSGTVGVGLGGSGAGGGDGGAVSLATTADISTAGISSNGILAQSVGGGGGNGGFNVAISGSGAGTASGAVSVGLGGSGAGGGNASTVNLITNNDVTTLLDNSVGIVAQSIGGGGGNGGFNVNVSGSGAGKGSAAIGVGLGGSAGTGGYGSTVISNVSGDITTSGDNSGGLLVQSVGGGGGNGGFNVSAAISGAGKASAGVAVGIGGSGGGGGAAGVIDSTLAGDIRTSGKDATAVIAQSIGGGGGNGGVSVAGTISGAKSGSAAVSVSIGGSGGSGGNANTVDNIVSGNIVTSNTGSGGVLAQSVGGGGGNGGISVSGSLSVASSGSGAVSVGVGGSGGLGGNAMRVTNNVSGTVFTTGADAFGIIAQSLGGGGGNGGLNVSGTLSAAKTTAGAIGVGVGGAGGGGGLAANVNNTVSGYVQTTGDNATGILAQSLGGGGGNGGLNVSGVITGSKTRSGGLSVGVGGFGGNGGSAGDVTNTLTGGTMTTGNNASAVIAQSLGGGGGNGGLNVSAAVNLTKENGGTLGVGVGGFGGNGGDAGNVSSTITTTSTYNQIGTTGDDSPAVIAQSIGGGGGNGGLNVTGALNATGKNGAAIGIGVGGFGGGAGNAGNVSLGVSGPVVTMGNSSHGLVAQSIGGGGGNGATNVTGLLAINTTGKDASFTSAVASIGVGGFGGGGGTAGNVDLTYTGTIDATPTDTTGEGSHGILAQSLGGGGGNGGVNVSAGISFATAKSDDRALLIGVGGFGGTGGSAGAVDVTVTGGESISAYGTGMSAIMAQSSGGGGGNGGINVSGGIVTDSPLIVGFGGLGGNGGIGDNVTVNATTDVFAASSGTTSLNSAGILAQSLGGGGGNGGINVSGGLSLAKEKDVPSITVGIGGFGGAGAISGDSTVIHTGNSVTSGAWVHGIMAQSIAGGGGNGALNVSGQLNFDDSNNSGGKTDLSIVAGIGGNGGLGADAGNVSVSSTGTITTSGDHARGIFAQSIGGGGGTGGMNVTGVFAKNSSPVSIGVGGTGSGGGHAGSVSVTRGSIGNSAGKITTDGMGATGIEASSIGGGGGVAGMNFIVGISLATDSGDGTGTGGSKPRKHPMHTGVDDSVFTNFDAVLDQLEGKAPVDDQDGKDANKESPFAAQIAIGGSGGDAGHGGAARVDNVGDVETKKNNSHGIMAQSIGGGGGNANFNMAYTYQGKSDKGMGYNFALGGGPGDAGNGNTADVTHDGNVETFGNNSYGILSQSIGGGGGNVAAEFLNRIDPDYMKLDTGGKVGITLGRRGGTGGSGGDVTLASKGTVMTHGNNAFGLLAQSVGNGGGNSSSTSVELEIPKEDDSRPERAGSVSIGLEGGVGGVAGDVILTAQGWVSTDGTNSHAIFAQSVGGGGGNGGDASGDASTMSISIGGTGGQGGVGGIVNVTSSADVRTSNTDSVGILAQSIGGGGGTGGAVKSEGIKGDGAQISVGGSGGVGMAASAVTVTNSGVVITDGSNSHGVLAQSLGGGGGNAGMVTNKITNEDESKATQLSVSLGGNGGAGAVSDDVTATNTGGIGTNKQNSIGIFAQSIGGGGGNANTVLTGTLSDKGAGNNISVGIGGSGGTGAAAGNVTVSNLRGTAADSGQITTLGNYSHGIMAMSVGGGGGNASKTITSNQSSGLATSSTFSSAVSIGGSGGTGGTGGNVNVINSGGITTHGDKAHGVVAQSVGGGGGSGGMSISGDLSQDATAAQSVGSMYFVGGAGGSGNTSGDVTVNNSGTIEIFGDKSYGIYAQSVGGGGGDGGFSSTLSRNLLTNVKTALKPSLTNIAIGGSGGSGADSGDVIVNHTGSITVHGDDAFGIYAQSVSGGGGNAGYSVSSPAWMAVDYTISTLLGARTGSVGTAGTVTVNTTGNISMLGANSQAQFTQSVNGGGGNIETFLDVSQQATELGDDGFELPGAVEDATLAWVKNKIEVGATAVNNAVGSVIDATHVGDLVTMAEDSYASLMQTIGGGGGNADVEVSADAQADIDLELVLGGSQSTNNNGGAVTAMRTGNVGTFGDDSQAGFVQSIGGGGGNLNVKVRRPSTVSTNAVSPLSSHTPADAIITLGSTTTSTGNHGGDVDLTYTGDMSTLGASSAGLVIQSIGAGGGQLKTVGLDTLSLALGASDNSSGNGGNINLANNGMVFTQGVSSNGVVIQSIGGGGGLVTTDTPASAITLTLNSDNSGNGGNISFTQTGTIGVMGDQSIAVIAQSLGGGGGVVDRLFADTAGGAGTSGNVTLSLDGDIVANGQNGVGVLAQSRGASGQGDINVTLEANRTIFAGTGGIGVQMSGGASNTLTNRGTVSTTDGDQGWAVVATEGNDFIDNTGILNGQVDLGTGINQVLNQQGFLFAPGAEVRLGLASNQVINNGSMMPSNAFLAQRTDLTGSFTQSSTGTTFAELDFGTSVIDSVYMTGAADLGGEIDVSLLNPNLVPIGSFQQTMFSADQGLTDSGVFLTTAPSVVITYDLLFPDANSSVLGFHVDFNPAGLGRNLAQVGEYFNRIQIAGSSPALATTVTQLLFEPTMDDYRRALSQLTPDFYGEHQAEMIRNSQRFNQVMAKQSENTSRRAPVYGKGFRSTDKDKVLWFLYDTETNIHEAFDDYKQVNHQSTRYSMGVDKKLDGKWSLGLGFSYESNQANGFNGQWTSSGHTSHIGAELKRQYGDSIVSLVQSYSWSQVDSRRAGQVTTAFQTDVSREMDSYGTLLRMSKVFNSDKLYFRTALDLGFNYLKVHSSQETGAAGTNLTLLSDSESHTWLRPMLGMGYKHRFGDGTRLNVNSGLAFHRYLDGSQTDVIAGFEGAPAGVDPMRVAIGLDKSYVDASLGVNLLTTSKVSVDVQFNRAYFKRHYDLDRWSFTLSGSF